MADIIRLLPDSVANQIAAGEVVQRPASALKELLENAIDAGASDIRVILRESGKSLIQVIDNGSGMSERDARLCFERHATSKIITADDLTTIRTLGFRGEALASIASVAQVELKTRKHDEEVGTSIIVEGSEIKNQGPVNCHAGTSISLKNLFFNVPARRNFLKSNTLELKYLLDEFFRVTLVNPDKTFTLYHNDRILHQLSPGNLKNRIISIFGANYNQRLIPVEQPSPLVNITGFIGKPEFARKSRGEQFFFTNGRYIRNPYLHHAVESAFKELIPGDAYPSYFLYLEVDPRIIDVNIHPTKTEINFQDIKSIYAILHAAVKQSTGRFNLSPTLNFDNEPSMDIPPPPSDRPILPPSINFNPDYNPFEKKKERQPELPLTTRVISNTQNWEKLYEIPMESIPATPSFRSFQVGDEWIVTHTRRGIVIIHQQHAHERILYEQILAKNNTPDQTSLKLSLPQTLNLQAGHALLLEELLPGFTSMGFEIEPFGHNSFLITAIPAALNLESPAETIEGLLEQFEKSPQNALQEIQLTLARSLAQRMSIKRGTRLKPEEMDRIVEQLYACSSPEMSPGGKPVLQLLTFDDLRKYFKT